MSSQLLKASSYGLNITRTVNYAAQSALLPLIDRIWGQRREKSFAEFRRHLALSIPKLKKLYDQDADNILNGLYPASILLEDSPVRHYLRLPQLIADAARASQQRARKETAEFEEQDRDFLKRVPDYYRRNFHFQRGGYLNDTSAKLYDHQVEILFMGTADIMRRQVVPPLKHFFNGSDGEGLRFLEIGSGTGALTRAVALAFPKAQITCVDASPHYLKHAQLRLKNFKSVDYIHGFGEDLNFRDQSFDAVFSCYLFHELPLKIRQQVIAEKFRVLKKGGLLLLADSIQLGDDPDLEWALKEFPLDFHEPFYKNYIQNNLADLLAEQGLGQITSETHFLTKVMGARKL